MALDETKLQKQFDDALSALTAQKTSMDTFIKEQETVAKEGKETSVKALAMAEKAAEEMNDAVKRIKDIEQQVAEGIKAGKTEAKESIGDLFAKSDAVKRFFEGSTQKAKVEFKETLSGKNTVINTDSTTAPQRNTGLIPGSFRRLTVRDIVPVLNTTANVIETPREATYTNNAAETEEGTSKPESAITFELLTTNIRTIAHFLRISKQLAADAPTVASYINVRLAFGVDKRIDQQIVSGNGTGQNLSGMTKSGNFTAFTPTSALTRIDSVAQAIADLEGDSEYYATGILMNPKDVWAINMQKTTDGLYIFGDPSRGPNAGGLWGLPLVASNAMPAGKFLVADFGEAYTYWNREGTVVEMFEQDADNVTKNLITVRAEARGGLETRLPAATRYGSLLL